MNFSVKATRIRHGLVKTLIVALALHGAGAVAAAEATVLRIGGTGNALGTMRLMAEAFNKSQARHRAEVLPSVGSSGAIRAVPKGALQIGLVSRPLTDAEAGSSLTTIEYARTPTVFAVPESTAVRGITRQEVADIYAGEKTRWADGGLIRPVMRQPGDDNTQQIAGLSPAIASALARAEQRAGLGFAANDQEAADKLESIEGSFGVTTVALIRSEKRRLRALVLDGVEPSAENLRNGRYPLVKRFHLIVSRQPTPAVLDFIAFVKSAAGRKILEQTGHALP